MSSSGTCRLWCASVASLPPENPVQPNVVKPVPVGPFDRPEDVRAVPEPLIAMSRSPGEARFLSCSTKTRSKPSSLPQARM